jgi:hypothetical protein
MNQTFMIVLRLGVAPIGRGRIMAERPFDDNAD